jgi:hypothetical protein
MTNGMSLKRVEIRPTSIPTQTPVRTIRIIPGIIVNIQRLMGMERAIPITT